MICQTCKQDKEPDQFHNQDHVCDDCVFRIQRQYEEDTYAGLCPHQLPMDECSVCKNKGQRKDNPDDLLPNPGDYGKGSDGKWFGCPPARASDTDLPLIANLSGHQVIEHEDGTITVSPSILIAKHTGEQWHGYLERGFWREV